MIMFTYGNFPLMLHFDDAKSKNNTKQTWLSYFAVCLEETILDERQAAAGTTRRVFIFTVWIPGKEKLGVVF